MVTLFQRKYFALYFLTRVTFGAPGLSFERPKPKLSKIVNIDSVIDVDATNMSSKNLVDTRQELADLVKRKTEIAVSYQKKAMYH